MEWPASLLAVHSAISRRVVWEIHRFTYRLITLRVMNARRKPPESRAETRARSSEGHGLAIGTTQEARTMPRPPLRDPKKDPRALLGRALKRLRLAAGVTTQAAMAARLDGYGEDSVQK